MRDELDEVIAELRRLNTSVPQPARLPSVAEVRRLEQRIALSLHRDLRRYLLRASDVVVGALEPVTLSAGHTNFESVLEAARQMGVGDSLVPICEDNGDFYCIAASGEVIFWSHNGVTDERWPSLAAWISEVWIGGQ